MSARSELTDALRQVVMSQHFAVLATQQGDQPYMNLVAFVVSDDLLHVVFATSRNTQKYRNLRANNKVAMLIDSRRNEPSDLGEALAITALGSASELAENESEHLVETYLQRHPTLRDFIHQLETAIIRVTITDYIIARFDSVERIQMGS